MDLRIVKTKKSIYDAFLKLRARNALEKVKVNHLCELAMINKTTFYKHYQDVFALSEEIENDTITSIMNKFEHIDALYTDPGLFINGLYYAFLSHKALIMTLFFGRINALIDKAEKQLMNRYPSLNGKPENEIILSFLLRGASHVLIESKHEESIMLDTLTQITAQVLTLLELKTGLNNSLIQNEDHG